jgi:hypothetical protein
LTWNFEVKSKRNCDNGVCVFLGYGFEAMGKKYEILGCADDVSCVDGVFSVSLCMFVSAKLRMVSATALSFCTPKPKSEEFRNENGWQAVCDSKERSSFREELVLWSPGRRRQVSSALLLKLLSKETQRDSSHGPMHGMACRLLCGVQKGNPSPSFVTVLSWRFVLVKRKTPNRVMATIKVDLQLFLDHSCISSSSGAETEFSGWVKKC